MWSKSGPLQRKAWMRLCMEDVLGVALEVSVPDMFARRNPLGELSYNLIEVNFC